ncbi:glucans biosynthesis glucosyltransferase MdoH [Salipiger sp. P9]|uniref:glucans biosynthesis glucosyltransferase MdoH n=1 Tax=Salipiger pentaromativorans TaxID=2943193 RepID=UPI00215745C5|nr:glucans biosynthesis glucosyltransferase MdoH [Salipiger pentaromativorans]MCR8550997.1 glucans biosynthesis glucosyltransferase MdoH [Salipiger pentaromativorans]
MTRTIPALDLGTRLVRLGAISGALLMAAIAAALVAEAGLSDGFGLWDALRTALIFVTTGWLAWGAMLAFVGLPRAPQPAVPELQAPQPRTVVLVPICNEDPISTFARIQAMDASADEAGLRLDVAVLSDTQDAAAAAREEAAFAVLLAETGGAGRIFYRRRRDNRGRKAGNIESFIRESGGAYDFAVILDADSLMEGATIRTLIARMQQDPGLGLLQTLPRIVSAHSLFGRAVQFAAAFHGPVFTRGLARMQGGTGPFWGHNAIVRVRAFAESCALPELSGPPPFGGHILSHDYVEAALLARAGWKVQVDGTIGGSFEEGPENLLSFAKRDRRWCQGNLQHVRLLWAPGLAGWSRFVFLQGILAYVVSLLWAAFLLVSVAATVLAPPPDYFPEPHMLFPVFPSDRTKEITALALGIIGLLILPKLAILAEAARSGRVQSFGGTGAALASLATEILLSSLLAPVMMMFQLRAVLQVLSGRDGGWPAHARGEGLLRLGEALRASGWIAATGAVGLGLVYQLSSDLVVWMLPVCLPMIVAPALIAWTSRPLTHALFRVPDEIAPAPVVARYHALMRRKAAALADRQPAPAELGADATA